jgi:hypothetical protein
LGLPPHKGPNLPNSISSSWAPNTTNSLTPPIVETLGTADVETGPKLKEHREGQPLGEDVGKLRSRRDVEDTNVLDGNALTDKVKINLNIPSTAY